VAVEIRNSQRRVAVDVQRLGNDAKKWLAAIGKQRAILSVLLTDDRRMARLHKRWMDEKGPTDVMSFPMGGEILGDIVISVETAARRHPKDVQAEIRRYLVHGLLHLNGYDHATKKDQRRMDRRADRLLRLAAGKKR